MAIMQLPNAIEPKCLVNIHFSPILIEPRPLVSLVNEKYHTAQAAAIMN